MKKFSRIHIEANRAADILLEAHLEAILNQLFGKSILLNKFTILDAIFLAEQADPLDRLEFAKLIEEHLSVEVSDSELERLMGLPLYRLVEYLKQLADQAEYD